MRILAAIICFLLAFLMNIFHWHADRFGWVAMMLLGLVFLALAAWSGIGALGGVQVVKRTE